MTVRFISFNRWCAIAIDGIPSGYITFKPNTTMVEMHVSRHAPPWLIAARASGPYLNLNLAQRAIERAHDDFEAQHVLMLPTTVQ